MSPEDISKSIQSVFPWITDGTSVVVLAMLAGRALKALREGHGLVGLWRSIVYGSSYNPGNRPEEEAKKP